jgi:hypothetical protein
MSMVQMIEWMFPKNTLGHHEANVKTELKSDHNCVNHGPVGNQIYYVIMTEFK